MFRKMMMVGLFATLATSFANAQEEIPSDNPFGDARFGTASAGGFFQEDERSAKNRKIQQDIREAIKNLRDAESRTDRASAEDGLREALGADYDERLSQYSDYMDRLEKQLAEMRKKLERRRQAKKDMIELRIQVLQAEADDLGWPSRMSGMGFGIGGRAPSNFGFRTPGNVSGGGSLRTYTAPKGGRQ